MMSALAHRGPDGSGYWVDAEAGVALGHQRLSIIDLSPHGQQPMGSVSGRYIIVYNGEIYNYESMRSELQNAGKAPVWRGHSDTEVLLAAFDAWGVEETLSRCIGMFAIALWDRQKQSITFARDRIGEKPLYYGIIGGRLLFGSELKALRSVAGQALEIDRHALMQFMQYGYIPGGNSIFNGVRKLPAAHFVTISSLAEVARPPATFWTPVSEKVIAQRQRFAKCEDGELINLVHNQLQESVQRQMVSDVPVGAFLSGGIDSTLIVSLMQSAGPKIRTFTIGFNEPEFDEGPFAKAVANQLGTQHTELYVSAKDALRIIPRIPDIYDEPFADPSQIPTAMVCEMTRQHVTVALSGDGGDEMFAGYPRYWHSAALWRRMSALPIPARRALASSLKVPSPSQWDGFLAPILGKGRLQYFNGRRMHRLAQLLITGSQEALYSRLMSQWAPEDHLVIGWPKLTAEPQQWSSGGRTPIEAMRLRDIQQYLCDDLLVKVDRAAMSTGLETRAPFLDHKVVELALSLPEHVLVRGGAGKWVLRQILDRYVPRRLVERPKAGFSVPLGFWLRGPLREWADDLLDTRKIANQGYLNHKMISAMWDEHCSGKFDRSSYLWNILMFQAWLTKQD